MATSAEKWGGGLIFHSLSVFLRDGRLADVPLVGALPDRVIEYLQAIRVLPSTNTLNVFSPQSRAAATIGEMVTLGRAMYADLVADNGGSAEGLEEKSIPLTHANAPLTTAAIASWSAKLSSTATPPPSGVAAETFVTTEMYMALQMLRATGAEEHYERVLREMEIAHAGFIGAERTHREATGVPPRERFAFLSGLPGVSHSTSSTRHAFSSIGQRRQSSSTRDAYSRDFARFATRGGRKLQLLVELFPGRLARKEQNKDQVQVNEILAAVASAPAVVFDELAAQFTQDHAQQLTTAVLARFTADSDGGIVSTCVPALEYCRLLGQAQANNEEWPHGYVPWALFASLLVAGLAPARARVTTAIHKRRSILWLAARLGQPPELAAGHDYIAKPVTDEEEAMLRVQFKARTAAEILAVDEAFDANGGKDGDKDGDGGMTTRSKKRRGKGRGRGGGRGGTGSGSGV